MPLVRRGFSDTEGHCGRVGDDAGGLLRERREHSLGSPMPPPPRCRAEPGPSGKNRHPVRNGLGITVRD